MEQEILLKSDPGFNTHQRPAKRSLVTPTVLCLNIIWTTSLVYLTWYSFFSRSGGSLTSLYNDHFHQDDTLNVPGGTSFSPRVKHESFGNILKTMDGRLKDNSSIYRHAPSWEVDQAWDKAWHLGSTTFNVTAGDLRRAGFDPSTVVSWNDVDDAYPAAFEYTHLIHCLNTVRKEMWHEHYFPSTPNQGPDATQMRQTHAMHCLHMLLQELTCHADVNLIPLIWMPYSEGGAGMRYAPTGMFSTSKVCRDIDKIDEWLEGNHIEGATEMLGGLKPPADATLYPNDGYWAD